MRTALLVEIGGYTLTDGDWIAVCVLAFLVAATCGVLIVRWA